MRKFHRRLSVLSALALVLASVTGLLWAYAPYLYFDKQSYLKPKRPLPSAPALAEARLTATEILGRYPTAKALHLRQDFGRVLWEVETGPETFLVDALNGETLSPLPERLAREIAPLYVLNGREVSAARFEEKWEPRKPGKTFRAWVVDFAGPGDWEIVLNAETGKILEEYNDANRFHFWVTRLHQLQFFGTDKELTAIPGVLLLAMIGTGLFLWRRSPATRRTTP